ncbi:MAG: ATP-binding cassette domain-containing protein [Burkholderiaceae bacterium]
MSPLLSVEGLQVAFGTAASPVTVVDGIDLSLEAGQTLALVGESGSGKSVTALAIMGLLRFGRARAGRPYRVRRGRPADAGAAADAGDLRGNRLAT